MGEEIEDVEGVLDGLTMLLDVMKPARRRPWGGGKDEPLQES